MAERGEHPIADGPRLTAVSGRSRLPSAAQRARKEVFSALTSGLRGRRPELEAALATRVHAISDPHEVADPTYLHSLNSAIAASLDHAIASIELSGPRPAAIPPSLFTDARVAARAGVGLDVVLRRYLATSTVLENALVEEAERLDITGAELRRLLNGQATLFDRLIEAVSAEHVRERESWPATIADRRREVVKSLLAGEHVDHSELGYSLDGHHLGLMARGEATPDVMNALAGRLDRWLLAVCREEEPVWACWLGGRAPLEAVHVLGALGELPLQGVLVTVGEPGRDLAGWRLSHRQAKAALPIAESQGQGVVRYADVAVQASILRDDLVTASLHQLYLEPLEKMRDGGEVARETLRAYFAAERNVSSTAAALGIDRGTVTNRIRAVEALYGRLLKEIATDLETALRLAAV